MSYCKGCSLGQVNVIGAGVIGLTTALLLQQKGYDVTIIADYFPGDKHIEYTSPCAGARWKTLAPNSDPKLQRYDAVSFKFFWELARSCAAEAGIMIVSAYDYYEKPTEDTLDPWFKNLVPTFQFIDQAELPKNIAVGYHYTTGGKHRRQKVNCISEVVTDDIDVVVNCTGLRARELGKVMDAKVTPTRGQNVIIKAPHIRKTVSVTRSDSYNYIIPRSDGTVVLGTTKEEGNTDPTVNESMTKDILNRAYDCCPDLSLQRKGVSDLTIVGNVVGLRPTRKGGPRVQNEYFKSPSGKQTLITHNYGHDGSGYQSSWGTAQEAARLVHEGHAVIKDKSRHIRRLLSHL
ncbi:uncharacterized protein B0P05DRAFT_569582 [Gilbertella persicaria]|uniref:uncharacterized protein n=1 Tax=Gilbertella persicaria TaxID=101096 RepID=UPI00221F2D52|nr:uncharacterized protein B0P05DRAFT_569582 [Gilbertella persicaria]KAI8087631.1 hypothetical protein B0P05DRAFT_569582 [Gilbertella persicaria]